MTDATFNTLDVAPFDRGRLSERHSTWTIAGAGALTLGVLVGSWLVDHRAARHGPVAFPRVSAPRAPLPMPPAGLRPDAARLDAALRAPPPPALPELAGTPAPASAAPVDLASPGLVGVPPPARAAAADPVLLDPGYALGSAPAGLADSAPLPARLVGPDDAGPLALRSTHDEAPAPAPLAAAPAPVETAAATPAPIPLPVPSPVEAAAPTPAAAASVAAPSPIETVPLPTPRPAFPWAMREGGRAGRREVAGRAPIAPAAPTPAPAAPAAPGDNRGFLERFFGMLKPSGPALGYATPEDGLLRRAAPLSGPGYVQDGYTAVYDISAKTVTLPDGTRLEAHSGLGRMLDDPRSVRSRNVGATPPHLYDLSLRESLFHGVQALRLNPVGGGGVFGRTGLLAHTFMLGPNGDSNGCVSFRDYQSFLRAYQSGRVRRLAVVSSAG